MTEVDVLGVRDQKRGFERSQLERNDKTYIADLFCDVRGNLDLIADTLFFDGFLIRCQKNFAGPVS